MSQALGPVAQYISDLEARIARLERNQRTPQLGSSTIENGTLTVNDDTGNPMLLIGAHDDGTFAMSATGDNNSPAPSQPTLVPGIGEIHAIWDGLMSDGSSPLSDFDVLQVHVSTSPGFLPDTTTLQGVLHGAGNFRIGNLFNQVTYYVCFVVINNAGNPSAPSAQTSAIPVYTAAVLTYAGAPALDTLMGSISAAGSVDQYGNVVLPGTTAYGVGDNSYVQLRPGSTAQVRISSGNANEQNPAIVANAIITYFPSGAQGMETVLQTPFVLGQVGYGQIHLGSAPSDLSLDPYVTFLVTDRASRSAQATLEPSVLQLEVASNGTANGVQVSLDGNNDQLTIGCGFGLSGGQQALFFDATNGVIVFTNPVSAPTTPGGLNAYTWTPLTYSGTWGTAGSDALKAKLMIDNRVWIHGRVSNASGQASGSTIASLPSGLFNPSRNGWGTCSIANSSTVMPMQVTTAGLIQTLNAYTASTALIINMQIPLDVT